MSPVGEAPLGRVRCRPARIHARTTNTTGLMPVNTGRLTGLALAFAVMAAVSAAGQTLTPPGDAWIAPRTPDEQPDIQGTWTNETMTPLERPACLGDKAFYTEDEAAALVERALDRARQPANCAAAPGQLDRRLQRLLDRSSGHDGPHA